MATGFRTIPSAIAQQAALAQLREIQNPQLALDRDIQKAIQLQQLQQQSPENQLALQLRQAQLNSQLQAQPLQNAILAQKLQDLQNPQVALNRELANKFQEELIAASLNPTSGVRRAGVGAVPVGEIEPIFNPVSGEETPFVRDLEMRKSALAKAAGPVKPIEVNGQLVLPDAQGKYQSVFGAPKPTKSPFTQQTVVSLTDSTDVRQAIPDENGRPPEGYQFIKATEQPMKASEKITALKEVRTVYDDLPAKIDLFGKGQLPGSETLKSRLDTLLKGAGGDYNKLNPQAKNAFVFAMNNLRDPRSATLLREAEQIADRAGILDRFSAYVENVKTGDQIAPQVAKDIYEVISQVNANNRERLITSLIPLHDDLSSLNKKLTSLGVPKDIQDEVEFRITQGDAGSTPSTPQPSNAQNQEAVKWLKANPNDPRAAAVRQKLGL